MSCPIRFGGTVVITCTPPAHLGRFGAEHAHRQYAPFFVTTSTIVGNISMDPQFVDPTVPDVHLRSNSPCIDAGTDVGLPYLGLAPDMGAFEFVAYQMHLPLILKE